MKGKSSFFKDREFKTPSMCTTGGNFDCVAVAINKNGVAVRSTHDSRKTTATFTHEEWRNFTKAVRGGAFSV